MFLLCLRSGLMWKSIDQALLHIRLQFWWWCLRFFTVPNFGTAGIHSVHCSGIIQRFAREKKRDGFRTPKRNCTSRLWRFPNQHKDTHSVCFFWTLQSKKHWCFHSMFVWPWVYLNLPVESCNGGISASVLIKSQGKPNHADMFWHNLCSPLKVKRSYFGPSS